MPETQGFFKTSDGCRISYRLWRAGKEKHPLLVLVHGLGSNMTRWSEFVRTTKLRDSWDILRIDTRGHGDSRWNGRLGLSVWASDLKEIIEAQNAEKIILVGHSLGASITLFFAVRYKGIIDGLILIDPLFRSALSGSMKRLLWLRPILEVLVFKLRVLSAFGIYRRHLPPFDLEQLDLYARRHMAEKNEFPRGRYMSAIKTMQFTAAGAYFQDLISVSDPEPDVRTLDIPVLAIESTGNEFSDMKKAEVILRMIPHCDIIKIRAEHWVPAERPKEMREAIDSWCAGQL